MLCRTAVGERVSGMDAAERKAGLERMRAYVALLQPLMRLQHWGIIVENDPPQSGSADASCWTSDNCWKATLYFADRHFERDDIEQRNNVVHELLHIHDAERHTAILAALDAIDPTGRGWARERTDFEMERSIEAISCVLAPHLPLPPGAEKE